MSRRRDDHRRRNSPPLLDIVPRTRRIAAAAKGMVAALKTAERRRLAWLNAEVEPGTIRIRRKRALAVCGRMVGIGIIEVVVAVASGPEHLLSECPSRSGRRHDCGRCNDRNRREPKPHR